MEQRAIPLQWSRGQNETLTSMEYVITKELVSHILKSNNQIYFNLQETQRSRGQFLFLPLILVMAKLCACLCIAKNDYNQPPTFTGKWIWKLDTLPKIQTFIWCILHSIPTKEILKERGLTEDVHCQICNNGRENVLHVLRDCSYARAFWERTPICSKMHDFF